MERSKAHHHTMSYEKQFQNCYAKEEAMFALAAESETVWDTHLEVSDGSEDWFTSRSAADMETLQQIIEQVKAEGLTYTVTEVEA